MDSKTFQCSRFLQTVHQNIVSTPLWKTDDGFLTEVSQTKRQGISGFFDDVPVDPDAFRVCVSWHDEQGKDSFFKVPLFFLHVTKKDDSFTLPLLSDGTRAKQLMTHFDAWAME